MNIMKNGALFLLIILILGLILAPFLGGSYREGYTDAATSWADKVTLASGVTSASSSTPGKPSGGSYDNYDHFSGTSSPTVYYGPNGSTATVAPGSNGSYTITVTNTNGQTKQYTLSSVEASTSGTSSSTSGSSSTSAASGSSAASSSTFASSLSSMMSQFANKTFYGPNGGSARLFTGKDGQYAIEETLANGNTTIYTATNTYTYTYSNQQSGSSSTSGSSSSTSGSSSSSAYPFSDFSAGYATGPNGNSAGYVTGPNGNTVAGASVNNSSSQYNSSLPTGIPARMIPPGQEDLYILKSEVVPPVCPACPTSSACPRTEKCPPCPACARCPEPNFECKKVPNYNAVNDSYLPVPVLSNFSTFGM
jgi:hypothetical protein